MPGNPNQIPRGLSPPTRGNLDTLADFSDAVRSIPAHAGEPVDLMRDIRAGEVYPRPRGGTRCNDTTPPN